MRGNLGGSILDAVPGFVIFLSRARVPSGSNMVFFGNTTCQRCPYLLLRTGGFVGIECSHRDLIVLGFFFESWGWGVEVDRLI